MFIRLAKAALASAFLIAGSAAAGAQTVPPERILRMVPNADLQTLDPTNTTGPATSPMAACAS